jgi:hypothetical protein
VVAVAWPYVEIENTLHSDAAWGKRRGVNLATHSNWMHARLSMEVSRTIAGIYRRTRTLERDSRRGCSSKLRSRCATLRRHRIERDRR